MMRNTVLHFFFFLAALFFAPVRAKYRNVTIDNTDPSIQYAGNWSQCYVDAGTSYGGTRNCSYQDGASATFTFTGVAIYYIMPQIPGASTVLALDSEPRVLVNLSQGPTNWTVRWGESGLSNGPHTLVNYGPSNITTYPNGTLIYPNGTYIVGEVDAFIYTVVEPDHNIAAIVGGAVAGAVALALVGACYIFGPHLADWLRYLAFAMFGWLLFKGRRLAFISDVPNETQIALFLTLTPGLPSSTSGDVEEKVLCWKVLQIGPGKRQEVVHLPSRGRTGDPGLVFCTLEAVENGFKASQISVGAAVRLSCFAKYQEA
ncbi:hypothetical protein BDR05DRAFT_750515 [Suillus weaverae]|nr:hypothetical protein BDR05DRAFT_750515 [Suillus weaverae]